MSAEPGTTGGDASVVERLTAVRPSTRQLRWQQMEFYAFVHFGMPTMTDLEWGLGHEDPALFDPDELDVDQWMSALATAGTTGVILTAKHHDGFCLWPSAVTRHSVAASPWAQGRGDLVALVAAAAARHGLRFGVYLSPWDRTEASYGSGQAYDDFFVAQLTELLTGYGEVFSVWFDGANGEGPDGRVQTYDWDRYHEVVRRLQPDAVISVCGPDVRWCGNEAGHTRTDEWSVVPAQLRSAEAVAEKSQQVDDGTFSRLVRSDEDDLGSRAALVGHLDQLVWYPAEVNTSIRPGWFHHPAEDGAVRSAAELFDIWCSAVGGNACFLLNVPPTAAGRFAEPDVEVLADLGRLIRRFQADVLPVAVQASSGGFGPAGHDPVPTAFTDPFTTRPELPWFPAADDPSPQLRLRLASPVQVGAVVLREDLRWGQRVEDVEVVVVGTDGDERVVARAGSVGYQRILRFPPVTAQSVVVRLLAARGRGDLLAVAVVAG